MTKLNSQRQKIWAILGYYHPNFSGMAIQAHRTFCQLQRKGYEITVLTLAIHDAAHSEKQKSCLDGIEIIYLPIQKLETLRKKTLFHRLQRIWRVARSHVNELTVNIRMAFVLFRDGRSGDIVQIYRSSEFCFLVVLAARLKGMHSVILLSLLGADDPLAIKKNYRGRNSYMRLLAFRGARAIVGLSDALTDSARKTYPNKTITRISPGVDVERFCPAGTETKLKLKATLGLDTRKRQIAFAGAAVIRKGIDVLINAFVIIARQVEDVNLVIVGPSNFGGSNRHPEARQRLVRELKTLIGDAELTHRVHWTGNVTNVSEYLQSSDILCFPTRQEGFGIVLIEAMAVGLPVVTSRLDGITPNIITSKKEGVLISGHEAQEYANAITRLLDDSETAYEMGRCARARVIAEFTLEKEANAYTRLYRDLASTRSEE